MKKIVLSITTAVCLMGFGTLAFAEDRGNMKDAIKGKAQGMMSTPDGMKSKMGEAKGTLKAGKIGQKCQCGSTSVGGKVECHKCLTKPGLSNTLAVPGQTLEAKWCCSHSSGPGSGQGCFELTAGKTCGGNNYTINCTCGETSGGGSGGVKCHEC